MTNEQIARSVGRLSRGEFATPRSVELTLPTSATTVIDLSPLRQDLIHNMTQVDRWKCDLAPTLEDAVYAYVEPGGGPKSLPMAVVMIQLVTIPASSAPAKFRESLTRTDWSEAEWVTMGHLYLDTPGMGLVGPRVLILSVIAADGRLLDYGYINPSPNPLDERIDTAFLVYCAAVDFLNGSNITYVEPKRGGRAAQRRMMRYEITVHELVVHSEQEVRTSNGGTGEGTPLTSVRGHWNRYGPKYGRGKLFGRLEGRYWIPEHARGSGEFGVVKKNYRLEPDDG